MVVIPTEGDQIDRVMVAASRTRANVVRLEPVPASATVDLALALISIQHRSADSWRDGLSKVGDPNRATVAVLDHYSNLAGAQDLIQRIGAYTWAR
jgi:hypothetical protein